MFDKNNFKRQQPQQQSQQSQVLKNTIEVSIRQYKGMTFIDTFYLGFKLEVQSEIQPYEYNGKYYITYEPAKAGLLIKDNGYLFLCIKM